MLKLLIECMPYNNIPNFVYQKAVYINILYFQLSSSGNRLTFTTGVIGCWLIALAVAMLAGVLLRKIMNYIFT